MSRAVAVLGCLFIFIALPLSVQAATIDAKSFLPFHYGRLGQTSSLPADLKSDGKVNSVDFVSGIRAPSKSLHIRLSRSYLVPGESYTLFAVADAKTNTFYQGNLEVQVTSCDVNGANCVSSTGPWRNYDGSTILVNSAFTVTIPTNTQPGTYTMRFRPLPNPLNLEWSNQAQINIA